MKTENENRTLSLLQRAKKYLAQLITLKDRAFKKEFRDFITLDYQKVEPEDIKDIQRLKYLRNLDLAKTGYVNTTISNLISYYKKKRELVESDQEIIPAGQILIKEQETPRAILQYGYSKKNNGYMVAFHNHDNIPIWKTLDLSQVLTVLSNIHPKNGNSLQFEHSFFLRDIKKTFPSEWESIGLEYNRIIIKSYESNKYFENGIVKLNLDLLNNPSNYVGLPINFPSPQNDDRILKVTEANNRYFVFQSFLKTAPKQPTIYFTHDEIRSIYFNTQIDLIAKLKFNLLLGINNGRLFIGRKNDESNKSIAWNTLEDCMNSPVYNSKTKYYLSKEIILKKNFVIEEGAIRLENGTQTAYLKRHFKNGEWYYAEIAQKNSELNFRPLWNTFKEDIRRKFPNSDNLERLLNTRKTQQINNQIKI